MKKVIAIVLAYIVMLIGFVSTGFYFAIHGWFWYHYILLVGTMLLTVPAIDYWYVYFKRLFGIDNEN